jgi:hypothetical protein
VNFDDISIGQWVWVAFADGDEAGQVVDKRITNGNQDVQVNLSGKIFQCDPYTLHMVGGPHKEPEPDCSTAWMTGYQAGLADGKQERDTEWANKIAPVVNEHTDSMDPEAVASIIKQLDHGYFEQVARFTQMLGFIERLTNGKGYPYYKSEWTPEMTMVARWLSPDFDNLLLVDGDLVHIRVGKPATGRATVLPPSKYVPPMPAFPPNPAPNGTRLHELMQQYILDPGSMTSAELEELSLRFKALA